jgi:SAM-dependent methyltransferase
VSAAPDPATTYGAHANPDLLARIPLDARAVLDVGCGAGALGAAFRRRNPAARLIGIEPDPTLRAHAATHYDLVRGDDIEAVPPPVEPGSLDALVFGDVLEHLADPWAVLRRDRALLSDRGVLLICVPNIEHWSFAARLLRGEWRYERMGLFDETHLRWFTRDTMRHALEEAGYVPLEVAPRIFGHDRAEEFARRVAPALSALGVDAAEWRRRAFPLQYVWRAARVPPDPLLLLGRTLDSDPEGARRRILDPFAALATRPGVGTIAGPRARLPDSLGDTPRIVVLQGEAEGADEFRAAGAVVVRDVTDVSALHPTRLRAVHALQVPDMALRNRVAAINPEVAVFPDAGFEGEPRLADQMARRLAWYRGLWERRTVLA